MEKILQAFKRLRFVMPSSMQLQMYYDDKNKHFPSPPPPESQNKMTPQQSHNDKPFGGFLGAVYDRYDHNQNALFGHKHFKSIFLLG